MSPAIRNTLIALVGGTLGYVVGMAWLSGSSVNGTFVPMGTDAFLHASRILETFADTAAFYQWDTRGFAPDGAFFHWPWPFDLGLALLLHPLVWITDLPANTLLMLLPPWWAFINAAILVLICQQLGMRSLYTLLTVVCFFLCPATQVVHAVGAVDHNFAEQTLVLLSLLLTLRLFAAPDSQARAIGLGICLGLAIGVSITLFLLQLPLLACATWAWWRGRPLSPVQALSTGISLVLATLAVAAFSLPLQQGYFDYSYLSWFQVYVALMTAIGLALLAWLPCSTRGALITLGTGLALLVPIAANIFAGFQYLSTADQVYLSRVTETRSLFEHADSALVWFSGFVLLIPVILLGCVRVVARANTAAFVVLAIFASAGLLLFIGQYRFNHFGTFALYLPLFCFLDHWQKNSDRPHRAVPVASVAAAALLQIPSFSFLWLERYAGWNDVYARTLPIYEYLAELCEARPGIVLAPLVNANYIHYHTRCSVYGTAMYGARNAQTKLGNRALRLLNESPETARDYQPAFDYVLAVRAFGTQPVKPDWARKVNSTGLNGALLAAGDTFPPGYRLLMAADYDSQGVRLGLTRLFLVERNQAAF
ncbi:MAG: hypothetical protein ACFHX7_20990 [Pseudomonadota bacterium]